MNKDLKYYATIYGILFICLSLFVIFPIVEMVFYPQENRKDSLQEIATIYRLVNDENLNDLSLFQSKLTDPTWRDNVNSAKEICEHYLRYSLLDFDDNMAGILYNQCRLSLQIAQNQIEN